MSLSKMHIGLVCGPIHRSYGGPAAVVEAHAAALAAHANLSIFGVFENWQKHDLLEIYEGDDLTGANFPRRWFFSNDLFSRLKSKAPTLDVIHAHMLWDYPVWAAYKISKMFDVPFIVTLHGSLIEAWRRDAPHKRAYRALIADRMLKDAAAIHCLSAHEANELDALGFPTRRVVIPNGLPASAFNVERARARFEARFPSTRGKKIVSFLGRVWHEKGLDILPEAWDKVIKEEDAIVVVAGPDYKNYMSQFRENIRRLGLEGSMIVAGPIYGEDKSDLLAASDIFVLPSLSESYSMALLEAAAAGIPCIYTEGCNMPDLAGADGGWIIDRSIDGLATALITALKMASSDRLAFGANARRWAGKSHSLESVGARLRSLYGDVAGKDRYLYP